jgi:hypothetical protein
MAAAFLEPDQELMGLGDDLAVVAFARAASDAINETPEDLSERMREALRQLDGVPVHRARPACRRRGPGWG